MNQSKSSDKQCLILLYKVLLVFLTMLPLQAFAQSKVTGTVFDESNGEPVIGATVKIKGSGTGTVTDIDGNFSIDAATGQQLEVSYIGYITQTIRVPKSHQVDVRLTEDTQTLDQVVVVGYGTMKRSDLTGSVSSINEEQIKQGVNTSVEQAMQGRIAGVQVTQNSGAPGGGISVQIRGVNTFSGNEPLYVVDGIAMSGQTSDNSSVLSTINPSDITSIEVLKDASATAIYGSRASNGVVLITTRRGQEGKPKLSYEGYAGWQKLPGKLEVMNLKEFAKFYNVRAEIYGYGKREELLDESLLTDGTDWQDELYDVAFMHNHQINVNGGTNNMHYSLSGGFLDQDGIGVGSNFRRASFRANFDVNVTDWLQVGMYAAYASTKQVITFDENSVIRTALVQYPDMAPRNPDGSYDFGENLEHNYNSNPLFEAEMRDNNRNNQQFDYNAFANVTPIKGLTLRIEYGGNRSWGQSTFFQPNYHTAQQNIESQLTRGNSRNKYESFKQYATYEFEPFKGHRFNIMAGHESQEGEWYQGSMGRKGYLFDSVKSIAVGDASTATNGEQGSPWSIESYYGRFNYNLLDRYLLTATIRADGSSSFGDDNKWGYFPSAALAWRITQEKFMENVKWLRNAKLRLGWGIVGNQQAGNYAYGIAMKSVATAWGTGFHDGNYANPGLKWEETKAYNIGLDLSFFDNRIEFIIDAYLKKTDNLLMSATLPSYNVSNTGWKGMSPPQVNTGVIQNKGIEFTLNTVNVSKNNFEWRTGATLSLNRNKVTHLYTDDASIPGTISGQVYTLSTIDGPVGRFYGYNVIGMFTREDDFYQKNQLGEYMLDQNGNRLPVARPADSNGDLYPIAQRGIWVGDYMFEDVNGDGKITVADRKFIGDPNPDFTFGINNVIRWKDLELSFFFNGSVGNDVFNLVKLNHSDPTAWGNKLKMVSDYAQIGMIDPEGSLNDISNVFVTNPENAKTQRISVSGESQNDNNRISSRFIEDGSYIRLKTISLSYNLPKRWLKPLKLDWVQVYVNAQNLITITGYDGYDPELGSIGQSVILQGIDNYRYPSPRIYNVGLKVNF
ncbi:MAG: TonB-dependent receptor [Prevotella sp.]|nr:TonB-dependent receptor [Prevotella sp.]